jgi:hypothetical protein
MPALDKLARVADVSFTIARRAGSLAISTVRQVADMALERRSNGRARSSTWAPPPASGAPASGAAPSAPAPAPAPARPPAPAPAAADAPVPTPAAATVEPAPPEAADDHVDREAVVVAESADQGAADGAGAQVRIGEPWEGYGSMTAKEVNARLAAASPASLGVARLYEAANRNRVTVLREIDRRLSAAEG